MTRLSTDALVLLASALRERPMATRLLIASQAN
jgi:hypothetical protein